MESLEIAVNVPGQCSVLASGLCQCYDSTWQPHLSQCSVFVMRSLSRCNGSIQQPHQSRSTPESVMGSTCSHANLNVQHLWMFSTCEWSLTVWAVPDSVMVQHVSLTNLKVKHLWAVPDNVMVQHASHTNLNVKHLWAVPDSVMVQYANHTNLNVKHLWVVPDSAMVQHANLTNLNVKHLWAVPDSVMVQHANHTNLNGKHLWAVPDSVMVQYASINNLNVNSLRPNDAIWRYRSMSTLVRVMACCLTAPSHYLSQCWLIISEV